MGIFDNLKSLKDRILDPAVALLKFLKIPPDAVTWTGFFVNIGAAYCIVIEKFVLTGSIILAAGIFDMLDGLLAKKLNKKTKFGGFLDSAVDRLSEAALFIGIIIYYLNVKNDIGVIITSGVLFVTFLVSYLRARASGLQIDCEVGIFTRTERIFVLIFGFFFNQLYYALIIILILSIVTVIQRFIHIGKEAKKLDKKGIGSKRKKKK